RQQQIFAVEGRHGRFLDDAACDLDGLAAPAAAIEGALELIDVPGGRERPAALVSPLKRAIEPFARGADEQGKQQFFLVESGELLVDLVAEIAIENFAVAVAQKSI